MMQPTNKALVRIRHSLGRDRVSSSLGALQQQVQEFRKMTRRVEGTNSRTKMTALKIKAAIRVLGQSVKFAGGQAELIATKSLSGGHGSLLLETGELPESACSAQCKVDSKI